MASACVLHHVAAVLVGVGVDGYAVVLNELMCWMVSLADSGKKKMFKKPKQSFIQALNEIQVINGRTYSTIKQKGTLKRALEDDSTEESSPCKRAQLKSIFGRRR